MQLFAGLERTDYQDVLRALGYLCDSRGWRNLRLVEHEEGLVVQFSERASDDFTLYLFTDDDLRELLREAYGRRIPVAASSVPSRRLNTDRLVTPPTMPTLDPAAPPPLAPDARGEAEDQLNESAFPFQTLLSRVNARGVNQ